METLQRVGIHVLLAIYVVSVLSGLYFTLFRRFPPLAPKPLVLFEYFLMAPFQEYNRENADLLAEGWVDGSWVTIDLDPYYPTMILGTRTMHRRLMTIERVGEEEHRKAFHLLAENIFLRETERGRGYRSVRLSWETWPKSTAGFTHLRHREFIERTPLVMYP